MGAVAHQVATHIDPDVFISYRRSDKEFVERFVAALERHGPEVWWDADIGGGEDWRDAIVENLVSSNCLVIIFSESCNASKQLVKELAVADHLNKVVIPVKIDAAEPKGSFLYELAWRNWVNVHPDPMSKLDAAAASIVGSLTEAGWTRAGSGGSGGQLSAPTLPTPAVTTTTSLPPPAAPAGTETSQARAPGSTSRMPSQPVPPPAPSAPARPSIPIPAGFRFRDAFPFHWADFILPALFGILVMLGGITNGDDAGVVIGAALGSFAMALALVGLIVFPIRYYRRRANPFAVARNLVISNVTFGVVVALGFWLAPVVNDGETANEARMSMSIGMLIFALGIAALSFVIFFALSRVRAKRELRAHTTTV